MIQPGNFDFWRDVLDPVEVQELISRGDVAEIAAAQAARAHPGEIVPMHPTPLEAVRLGDGYVVYSEHNTAQEREQDGPIHISTNLVLGRPHSPVDADSDQTDE